MQTAYDKSNVLIEALPYFQLYDEKVFVIKLGGNAMGDRELFRDTLQDIVFMEQVGIRPVIVHGGGPHISSMLEAEGIKIRFVDGLRVSCRDTVRVAAEALSGVNRDICDTIRGMGGHACGLMGSIHRIFNARKKILEDKPEVDLGFVGEVESVDPVEVIELAASGVVPVISPLGIGNTGDIYNINADTAATRLAEALQCEKLVFMTNVAGVLRDSNDPSSLISTLTPRKVLQLKSEGIISGGMVPKADAALGALSSGVSKVHIVDGRQRHSLLLEIFTAEGVGTQFVEES